MNVPLPIIAVLISLFGGAILAGLGFVYRKLTQIEVRLATIEMRLGILEQI